MSLLFEYPGLHTTVQDPGRRGHRASGVSSGGAVDRIAAKVANWLVGNAANEALLECAITGPVIRFSRRAVVAICGAKAVGLPHGQPFEVKGGDTISLRQLQHGAYAYLAIAAGIDVPEILGSRSTDVRAGWGGHEGRLVRRHDRLKIFKSSRSSVRADWHVRLKEFYRNELPLRVIAGEDDSRFAHHWERHAFTVSTNSNRMGLRLHGQKLSSRTPADRASAPIVPGAIQVPADGQPILLLADAQTMGGYPVLAYVITADLPSAAQLRPGETVRFQTVSMDDAHLALAKQKAALARLRLAVGEKWS